MGVKETVIGAVVTMVIGGTAYTVNKADVVDNFADDTGLTQQQAEQYVSSVDKNSLVTYDKVGSSYVNDGNSVLKSASEIDCINFDYAWVTSTLECEEGKAQLNELGKDEVALGNSYTKLTSSTATRADISAVISYIDEVNSDVEFEVVKNILEPAKIDETKKSNSYNKATLQAALKSN